jgi:hypothetical protein
MRPARCPRVTGRSGIVAVLPLQPAASCPRPIVVRPLLATSASAGPGGPVVCSETRTAPVPAGISSASWQTSSLPTELPSALLASVPFVLSRTGTARVSAAATPTTSRTHPIATIDSRARPPNGSPGPRTVPIAGAPQDRRSGSYRPAGGRGRPPGYLICMPEIARAMTRRWISEVPSKIV